MPDAEPDPEPEPAKDPPPPSPRGTLPKGFAKAEPAKDPGPSPSPDPAKAEQIADVRARLAELRRAVASLPDAAGGDVPSRGAIAAYCIKCRKKTAVSDPTESRLKNGRPAVRGRCSECGSTVVRMGPLSPRRG